jgi:poly-gamma-glutamate capsule biosynthesis protein CapA/YwtB (metallophosphatase superfamily)
VNRRQFLRRTAAAAAGTLVTSRWSRAQDSTRTVAPDTSRTASGLEPAITVAAGGDTTLGYNLEAHFDRELAAGKAKQDLWPIYFAGIKPVMEAADLGVVNLECPFTKRGVKLQKNFNFRARPELVRILQEGSVDVVSLANNHTNDWGKDGVKDTIQTLDRADIEYFGAGSNLEKARRPAILERNGMKIGFIGWYFQAHPDMLEPEAVYATAKRAGVAGCYKDLACMKAQVTEDLQRLVPKVDFAVPFFHWGKEGSYEVRDYQAELAHLCIELGAKAVLGAHPHRLQGVEVYRGAPIFYSLGNFVYGGIKEPSDTLTMIARMRFTRSRVEAEVLPVQYTNWPVKPFQPFLLEAEAREQAMTRIATYSRTAAATLPQIAPYVAALPPMETVPADSTSGR